MKFLREGGCPHPQCVSQGAGTRVTCLNKHLSFPESPAYLIPMEKRRLGRSGIVVSEICMGTMTFGGNLNEKESFEVMDYAYDHGVDFFDTAEIYPVPSKAEWVNRTEEFVGKQHDFVASTIVGANSIEQLMPSLAAADLKLSDETLAQIDAISAKYPYPMG